MTVYGVASVLALIMDIAYLPAVVLLMGVTIAYDVMGGMRAVVISDVVQMGLLVAAVVLALLHLGPLLAEHWTALAPRTRPLLDDWGVSGHSDFGFWPMLFGGLFLYTAYYGCDQSQAQRLLAAHDERALERILIMNGLLRFPLVLAYCLLGLGLAAYAAEHPTFLATLPSTAAGEPNVNLVFPVYVLDNFAPGLAGLAIVGLFAAAMSSIDSALNSLSASTLEDVVESHERQHDERQRFLLSKLMTCLWGAFAVAFSFLVEHIAGTILEAINKIGSLVNGPLLGIFVIAIVAPGLGQRRALAGFATGLGTNLALWQLAPQVSWLWWNVAGCLVAVGVAMTLALPLARIRLHRPARPRIATIAVLVLAALGMLLGLTGLHLSVVDAAAPATGRVPRAVGDIGAHQRERYTDVRYGSGNLASRSASKDVGNR